MTGSLSLRNGRGGNALRAAAVLLSLFVLALLPAARADAAVPSDWAGVNAAWLFTAYPINGVVWNTQVDAMQAAGVHVVRTDAEWRRVEPNAPDATGHHYDWHLYDAVVATLARRGIRWYPIVDYSAPWASSRPGYWRAPPADVASYAAYAQALARRYGTGGTFWALHPQLPAVPVQQIEIWNEENESYFWPSAPDPARYADLYTAARTAIHAVDPQAEVVIGGLVNHDAASFLAGMLAARPHMAIDAVGLHAYAPTAAGVVKWASIMKIALWRLGRPNLPIEITEVGWTTMAGATGAVSDAARASLISQTLPAVAAVPGVTRLMVFSWTSRETFREPDDFYGLYAPSGRPHLGGLALAAAIHRLQPTASASRAAAPAAKPTPAPAPDVTPTPAPARRPAKHAKHAKPEPAPHHTGRPKPHRARRHHARHHHRRRHRHR
jgi:hypothetical protein